MRESVCHVTVKPKSPRNEVVSTAEGILVRVTASPVEGAANAAVLRTLADALAIPKSHLTVTAGATGKVKRIAVRGLTQYELDARLKNLVGPHETK